MKRCGHPPDEVSVGVDPASESHGTVAVEELLEEGAAGVGEPAAGVHAPVGVQQQLLEHLRHARALAYANHTALTQHALGPYLHALLPADPEISSR